MSGTAGSYQRPSKATWAGDGVTDSNGLVSFSFPPGLFSVPPIVTIGLRGSSAVRTGRVSAVSTSGCSIEVLRSTAVSVLGIEVLGATVPGASTTVHVHAEEPG